MGTSREEVGRQLKRNDYVAVIDTSDEWEDLIGKIEEFMAPDGSLHQEFQPGFRVVVFFPINRDDIRSARLVGVNRFTSFVRQHLRTYEGKQVFDIIKVEWFDPNDL